MKYLIILFFLPFLSLHASAQLKYTLQYKDSTSPVLKIAIEPSFPLTAPVSFIMPRSVPGTYGITFSDRFVTNIYAINNLGEKITMVKNQNDAPRWRCADSGKQIIRIEYEVNLNKMERRSSPADASIIRPGFVGILNYSVFGWIEGTEKQPVQCSVNTFDNWPVFSTNQPTTQLAKGNLEIKTESYHTLADGQIFMGTHFRVKEFKGLTPLFVASYCQTENEWLDDYGLQGMMSMNILKDYFGELPFQHYSIMLIKMLPLEPGNYPPFGMEHLNSSTFFGDTTDLRRSAMTIDEVKRTMPTFLHHMGHSLIPLRCYGDTYRPYVLEIPPIINNIWFNEGFMWFLPYDELKLPRMKTNFDNSVYRTSPDIKKLSLLQLSQAASVMYATDFRLGRGIYSRGALMALEMNDYLKEKTDGKKSMKDVFRYLYQWSKKNNRPFTLEEFPALINNACNIDLSAIYKKWQLPIE
jgi:predicted metalloprotease with PDZ domain